MGALIFNVGHFVAAGILVAGVLVSLVWGEQWPRGWSIAALLGALAALFAGLWFQPPPTIETVLVPDVVSGARLGFHFNATNKGPGEVEFVRYGVDTADGYGLDDQSGGSGRLDAGDTRQLNLPADSYNALLRSHGVTLNLAYRDVATGKVRTTTYQFSVPEQPSAPIPVSKVATADGMEYFKSDSAKLKQDFKKPCHHTGFGFHEVQDGVAFAGAVMGSNRVIAVDSTERTVSFATVQNGRKRLLQGKFAVTANGKHEIALEWCDKANTVSASIDGKQLPEIRNDPL
ncbi:hypothetical protein [Sphingomonas limnosediminicola]|uniref:hypothetical protein n=1 Tax=Sphingomonas limnosediminicola TaxID=940133 RepID=UPI0031E40484